MASSTDHRYSRIAITGGAGFIGSAIAQRLLLEGIPEVTLLSRTGRLPPSLQQWKGPGRVGATPCDIRDIEQVRRALDGCDGIFHQAALRVTQCAREPQLGYQTLVAGTVNVVSVSSEIGVKKLVAASSAIVYGEAFTLPITESHPLRDTSVYGIAKIHNENFLDVYWKGCRLNYTALRYFNVYGPGMTLVGEDVEVLIRWLDRIDSGLPPLVFGDGLQTLDWVYIDDVVEANWRALQYPASGEVFNVCSGQETTLLRLLELLCKATGKTVAPQFLSPRTVNHVSRRFGDPTKARTLMNFCASTPLEDGLARLVEWRAARAAAA